MTIPSTQYAPYAPVAEPVRTNVLAIVSLVSAFFIPVAGVITGHIALSQIKRTREDGHGLALAGVIVGYVSFAATVILVMMWLFVVLVGVLVAGSIDPSSIDSYSY